MTADREFTRVDIVRAIREECADTYAYADILDRDADRSLVQMTVRTLYRSILARIPEALR